MVQAVFFDVDGVLLDTIPVKGEAFVDAFDGYPDRAEEIRALHRQRGGVPRDRKIALILQEVYGMPADPDEVSRLTEAFAARVLDRVLAAPEIEGASHALSELRRSTCLHAVSAAPEPELELVLSRRGWLSMFRSVHGIPPAKSETVRSLLAEHNYEAANCALVGDSAEDREAARTNGVPFVFVAPSGSGGESTDAGMVPNLVSILEAIESAGRMGP